MRLEVFLSSLHNGVRILSALCTSTTKCIDEDWLWASNLLLESIKGHPDLTCHGQWPCAFVHSNNRLVLSSLCDCTRLKALHSWCAFGFSSVHASVSMLASDAGIRPCCHSDERDFVHAGIGTILVHPGITMTARSFKVAVDFNVVVMMANMLYMIVPLSCYVWLLRLSLLYRMRTAYGMWNRSGLQDTLGQLVLSTIVEASFLARSFKHWSVKNMTSLPDQYQLEILKQTQC